MALSDSSVLYTGHDGRCECNLHFVAVYSISSLITLGVDAQNNRLKTMSSGQRSQTIRIGHPQVLFRDVREASIILSLEVRKVPSGRLRGDKNPPYSP